MFNPTAHHPHRLASGLASLGRGGDKMLVHMSPSEVSGLQKMAMAQGGSLTINPHTGLVEANFLSKFGDAISSVADWLAGGDGSSGGGGDAASSSELDTGVPSLVDLALGNNYNPSGVSSLSGAEGIGQAKLDAKIVPEEIKPNSIAGVASTSDLALPKELFGSSSFLNADTPYELPALTTDGIGLGAGPSMIGGAPSSSFETGLTHKISPSSVLASPDNYGFSNDSHPKESFGLFDLFSKLKGSKIDKFLSDSTNKSLLKQLIPFVGNMISGGNELKVDDPNKPVFWNQHQKRIVNPRYGEPGQPYFIMEQSPGYFSSNYIAPGQMTTANGQGTYHNPYKGLSALPIPRKFVSGGVIKNFAAGGLTFNTFDPATAAMAMPAPPPPSTAMDAYLAPMMASTFDPTLKPFLPESKDSSQNGGSGTGGYNPYPFNPYGSGGSPFGPGGGSSTSSGGSTSSHTSVPDINYNSAYRDRLAAIRNRYGYTDGPIHHMAFGGTTPAAGGGSFIDNHGGWGGVANLGLKLAFPQYRGASNAYSLGKGVYNYFQNQANQKLGNTINDQYQKAQPGFDEEINKLPPPPVDISTVPEGFDINKTLANIGNFANNYSGAVKQNVGSVINNPGSFGLLGGGSGTNLIPNSAYHDPLSPMAPIRSGYGYVDGPITAVAPPKAHGGPIHHMADGGPTPATGSGGGGFLDNHGGLSGLANLGLKIAVPQYRLASNAYSLGKGAYNYFQNQANQKLANTINTQFANAQPGFNAAIGSMGTPSAGFGNMPTGNFVTPNSGSFNNAADFSNMSGSPMGSGGDPNSGHAHGGPIHHEGLGSLGYNTYAAGGKLLRGDGDGMSDSIPAVITGNKPQRAALADGEFVIPADVVSHLGNGSTEAGSRKLYSMMDKVRKARTGNPKQGKQINPDKFVPA